MVVEMVSKAMFLWAFFSSSCSPIDGARILMIPMLNGSHFLEMDGVGRPLVDRGHKVYVLLDHKTRMPAGANYEQVSFRSEHQLFHLDSNLHHKMVENSGAGMNLGLVAQEVRKLCFDLMSDPLVMPKLTSLNLDLVLVDNGIIPCFFLVPYQLGVPFVAVGTTVFPWAARIPVLPSVVQPPVGLEMLGLRFCDESVDVGQQSSFVKRACRLLTWLLLELKFAEFDCDYLRQFVNFSSVNQLRESAALTLVNSAHYLSTAMPKLPHVEYVGGLTTRPPKQLEPELETWMSRAANVVVVSFGSLFGSLPPVVASKLFEAFGKLNQFRFLFRFKQSELRSLSVPVNVRLMDWLPQNDALGHNSTVAFVTHSGNNGQQEALYHGVPMLCFYIQSDQKSNAKRVAIRGFGKMINIHQFTVDQLVTDLSDLIHNPLFAQRIKRASRIFHSDKHPSERAADAVEHVLKYGSEHLRPKEAYKLSWWQYYMLDVLAVVYLVTVVVVVGLLELLKSAFSCFVRRSRRFVRKVKSD